MKDGLISARENLLCCLMLLLDWTQLFTSCLDKEEKIVNVAGQGVAGGCLICFIRGWHKWIPSHAILTATLWGGFIWEIANILPELPWSLVAKWGLGPKSPHSYQPVTQKWGGTQRNDNSIGEGQFLLDIGREWEEGLVQGWFVISIVKNIHLHT